MIKEKNLSEGIKNPLKDSFNLRRKNKKHYSECFGRNNMYGGEDEIRTHATVTRPNAFRVRPLITTWVLLHNGAGEGNRTPAVSLGS